MNNFNNFNNINRPMDTAAYHTDNISIPGQSGGVHDTILVNNSGMVNLHSTFQGTNGFVQRDTIYGQTRLTDFFDPGTGNIRR